MGRGCTRARTHDRGAAVPAVVPPEPRIRDINGHQSAPVHVLISTRFRRRPAEDNHSAAAPRLERSTPGELAAGYAEGRRVQRHDAASEEVGGAPRRERAVVNCNRAAVGGFEQAALESRSPGDGGALEEEAGAVERRGGAAVAPGGGGVHHHGWTDTDG